MRLVARNVCFSYGEQPLLQDVSLEVLTGESLAILGPSGSGKTTLLALLGGVLAPNYGWVGINETASPAAELRSSCTWILQTTNMLSDRTVTENVAIGAYGDGRSRDWALANTPAVLDKVRLTDYAERAARSLSGGEQQRVAIARAMISDKPVLLADEPTGQLDQQTSAAVVALLARAFENRILVVVTHDPLVADVCTRACLLQDGHLVPT